MLDDLAQQEKMLVDPRDLCFAEWHDVGHYSDVPNHPVANIEAKDMACAMPFAQRAIGLLVGVRLTTCAEAIVREAQRRDIETRSGRWRVADGGFGTP
ncbi:hypothetical protein [Sphingomonas abietis]|uniref:Uncharacterized protein n=1 Tax=Sphingomonas abietis TaxID=3012344 RepID=A0ABY7NMN4_9SPHN|nr:hypothetical protein [Sphingomonas abietis]WBO21847.1 hypothetical protein PBT88_17015 [Sphingomonas abietis]